MTSRSRGGEGGCPKRDVVREVAWILYYDQSKMRDKGGGGGPKNPKICVTSFMDGPLPGPLCRVIASSSLGLLGLLQNELWKLKFLEHFRHEQNCNCQKLLQMVLFSPFPRRIPHTRSRAMNHRIFPHSTERAVTLLNEDGR